MPIDTVVQGSSEYRTAKYMPGRFHPGIVSPSRWGMIDFGYEPTCICAAEVTDADDTLLQAQPDCHKIPDNYDLTLAGAVPTVQAILEDLNIPAGWVNASTTYRLLARKIGGIFRLVQSFMSTIGTASFFSGSARTLNDKMSDLPPLLRATFEEQLILVGLPAPNDNTLVRAVLEDYGDYWVGIPLKISGLTI